MTPTEAKTIHAETFEDLEDSAKYYIKGMKRKLFDGLYA
jgi:hypothetical protein